MKIVKKQGGDRELEPAKVDSTTVQAPPVLHGDAVERAPLHLGLSRYGGPIALGQSGRPPPVSVDDATQRIRDLTELAQRYAAAGKPRIARDLLRTAKQALGGLRIQAGYRAEEGGLHQGLWRPSGPVAPEQLKIEAAAAAIESAAEQVAGAKAVPAVAGEGAPKKKIVMLFGLSGNPPTGRGGHGGIVRWGATDLRVDLPDDAHPERARENVPIDEVWALPVYRHAFASKSDLPPFDVRFELCQAGLEHMPGLEGRVLVKDTERVVVEAAHAKAKAEGLPPESVRVGTIHVIRHLMADPANKDLQFVLALGGDTYRDLMNGKWIEGDTLQQLLPIVVVSRKGVDGVQGSEDNPPPLADISSTQVRDAIRKVREGGEGAEGARRWLDGLLASGDLEPAVLDLALRRGLYAKPAPRTES